MTVLHWRLRSTERRLRSNRAGTWLNGGTVGSDTSQVAVVDTTGKLRLLPFKTDDRRLRHGLHLLTHAA